MAIPNGSLGTAIVITSPATIVLDTADIAPDTEAWYKFTTGVGVYLLAVSVQNTTTEFPYVELFESDGTTTVPASSPPAADRTDPVNFPVQPETVYYLKLFPDNPGPTAVATVNVLEAAYEKTTAGDLLIVGSDSFSPAACVIDQTTGEVIRTASIGTAPVRVGVNPSGLMLLADYSTASTLKVASVRTLALTGLTIARPEVKTYAPMSDKVDTWYLVETGTSVNGKVWKVTEAGVVTLKATLAETKVGAPDISVGAHKLYYHNQSAGSGWAVHAWDLDADVALADFAAGIANFRVHTIVVLANDDVLVAYINASDRTQDFVRHYDSAGATIQDFANASNWPHSNMCPALDDPLSFWWAVQQDQTDFQTNFRRIRLSDGVDVNNFTIYVRSGHYVQPETETDAIVEPSNSAVFLAVPFVSDLPIIDMLLMCDDTTKDVDEDEAYKAYIKTRAVAPGGDVSVLGGYREPQIVAKARAATTLQLTLIKDFGVFESPSTVSLAPAGAETRVIRKFEGGTIADAKTVECIIGDVEAVASQWAVDQLTLKPLVEGES